MGFHHIALFPIDTIVIKRVFDLMVSTSSIFMESLNIVCVEQKSKDGLLSHILLLLLLTT